MNWSSLSRTVPPAAKPLEAAAARAHLRLSADVAEGDEAEAADVEQLLDAAIATIDGPNGIGIAMISQTWRYSLDRLCGPIALPLGPVSAVTAITFVDGAGDTQTLDADLYRVDTDQTPAVITAAHGVTWPSTRLQPGAVKITFVAGYGATGADVPADLIAAIKIILRGLFEDPHGEVPKGAARILDRYRAGLVT